MRLLSSVSVAQTIIIALSSVELTSILVPSHRLRIMALLNSGCRATVDGLTNVQSSSTTTVAELPRWMTIICTCHVGRVQSISFPVSQRIRSPRKSDPGRIRYASDIDPTLADSIRGINGVIGFPLPTSQSKLWCFMQT